MRPPIIIINPDEMRWDAMGHMGNPQAQTPRLDQLAKEEAVSFRYAYCQNPVCVPSRCSFFTGLYPHVHGHRTMSYLLRESESSLFSELRKAGYHVWMNARNDLVAGQYDDLIRSHADEIYYGDPHPPVNSDEIRKMGLPPQAESTFPYSHFVGEAKVPMDPDLRDTKAAVNRILHPINDKPLCLFLGLVNPHPPYQAEEPFFGSIVRDASWKRIEYEGAIGKSRMIQRLRETNGMAGYTETQWNELRAVYLAQCAKVDTIFGMICNALKEAGLYDESCIFFLSDHGDFCGDYDLTEKAQNTFEDCLSRVPFLIKPPKGTNVDPGISDSLAELVDFYATAMDYAGAVPDHDHYGRTLRPIIENRKKETRSFVCCEGGRMAYEEQAAEIYDPGGALTGAYAARGKAQEDPLAHEKGTMIFDGSYKYVHRLSGNCELYDLRSDPEEKRNLYGKMKDSEPVIHLRAKLLDWYQATCDVVPKDYDTRFTIDRVWASVQNICSKGKEQEVLAYIREKRPSILSAVSYVVRMNR